MMTSIGFPVITSSTCPKCGAALSHAFTGLAINMTGDDKQYGGWRIHCEKCQFKTEAVLPIVGSIKPEYPE